MADTNAKTIQDLNQTTAVSGDDLVVVAQSGATEAAKATVSTLAEAVGELNSTGALAELSLATSIGKNLLAQNLTNKGVPTDPSETLVQMADKLGGLTTNDALTFIKGSILSSNSTSLNVPTDIRDFAVIPNVHDHFVVHAGQALHIIPRGNYYDLPAMIGASVADVAAHSYTSTTVNMGRSADGNTIVVSYGTNTAMDIYDIDWSGATPIISYLKTVTIPYSTRSSGKPGITNDRELATASQSNGNYMGLFLVNDTTVYKVGSDGLYISSSYQDQIYFDINEQKEGYLYTAGHASSSGDSRAYKSTKIKYVPTTPEATGSITIENPGVTLYPIGTTAGPSASERSSFIDFDSGLLIRTYCINYNGSGYTSSRAISGQLSVLNLKDESKPEALTTLNTYACVVNPGQSYNYGITNAGASFQNRPALCVYGFPVINKSDTTWQLNIPQFEQDEIVYDNSTGMLSRTKTSCALADSMNEYRYEILLSANDNGYMYAYTYAGSYYGQANVLAKDVITMVHLNFNNTPVDLPITAIKSDEINGLKTETLSVPLPEDPNN